MKLRTTLVALLSMTTAACVTVPGVPFQMGKPVDKAPTSMGKSYRQDGVPLRLDALLDGLEASEPSRAEAQSARSWGRTGRVLGGVGGFGVGYGLVTGIRGEKSGWAILGAGAAVTAAGFLAAVAADGHAEKAVNAYNAALTAQPPLTSLLPFIGPIGDPGGPRCSLQAGIAVRF